MATFVLVHGGGLGGWCYQPLAKLLGAHRHDVYRPSLTGLGDRWHLFNRGVDLDRHIRDITELIRFEQLRDVILVGHGYGGMVITGAADRLPERVAHLVFLDAASPHHGQSLTEVAPGATAAIRRDAMLVAGVEMCLIPNDNNAAYHGVTDTVTMEWMAPKLMAHPWRCFAQPLMLENEAALEHIPRSHIRCQHTRHPPDSPPSGSRERVWLVNAGHDLMLTAPIFVAERLHEIACENT